MEEESAEKNTAATVVSPEFLGDVDEHRHLSDREEDEEEVVVAVVAPREAPVAAAGTSGIVEDMNVSTANHHQDTHTPTEDHNETLAPTEPLTENIDVHESFLALEELQESLDGVSSAQLGNGNEKKSSRDDKEATSSKAGGVTEQPAKKRDPNPAKASMMKTAKPPKRNKLPRVAALQKSVPLPKNTPSKTQTKKMTSLPRVAMLPKTRPVNTGDLSSKNAKPTKKLTGLPRVAMLQRPSHHPPAQPHHPMSKQERDLLECQKKFKARPLPKSLYSGTKASSSTLNADEPEYMKPTLSYLAKVRASVTELRQEDGGSETAVASSPIPASRKATAPSSKKTGTSAVSPPKTAKNNTHATTDTAVGHDELDALLGGVEDALLGGVVDASPPPSKNVDQKTSPDDVQMLQQDEGTTKPQEDAMTMEPTKLEFD